MSVLHTLWAVWPCFFLDTGDSDRWTLWEDDPIPRCDISNSSSACSFLIFSSVDVLFDTGSRVFTFLRPSPVVQPSFSFRVVRDDLLVSCVQYKASQTTFSFFFSFGVYQISLQVLWNYYKTTFSHIQHFFVYSKHIPYLVYFIILLWHTKSRNTCVFI